MKFQVGERVCTENGEVCAVITEVYSFSDCQRLSLDGFPYLGFDSTHFILEQIYSSPLYQALK